MLYRPLFSLLSDRLELPATVYFLPVNEVSRLLFREPETGGAK